MTDVQVGDVLSVEVTEYRWWERALWRLTFRRYQMRGRQVRRTYTVTSSVSA